MGASDPDDRGLGHAETATPETVEEVIDRPAPDQLARAVARARIANKLFAKQDQVHVGRYHLLEMVGAGGMGVVWGAWDPELERRVAIKLVKATMQAARDRILLEGQALARLSHPNVVAVYDVGVIDSSSDGQVYIVMEWVRGQTLRAYCKTARTLREIVAVYRAAGEGLAAAHAEGLIHRDFKPDNAIRGDDARVRVLDFGLARNEVRPSDSPSDSDSSDLTRGAGTPRYMPPEQADGRSLTPAVDQYAFCVSLREAVVARNADGRDADVPGWIAAICTRGTAREAGDRFASMAELLRALARDPATIWRRRAIAVGALAAVGTAFAVGNLRASDAVEPCSGGRAELAQAWSPQAQAQLASHLGALGAYGAAEAPRLRGELDQYAARWVTAHRAACTASRRGELTPQIYERNLGCLARARTGLATAVELLGRVPAERLSDAIVATRGLPSSERCLTETQASTVEPPPPALAARAAALGNEVARLRVLAQAADPTVERAAEVVVEETRQLGYLPLLARAYLVQGLDLVNRDDPRRALTALERAATTALDAGDPVTFVEAYAREIYGAATTLKEQQPENAATLAGAIPYVERIARQLGAAAAFERPLLYNNIGVSRMSAGDKAAARTWFQRAIDEPRAREGDLELLSAVGNLALIAEPAEREGLLERERKTLARLLGPNHIRTIEARYKGSAFTSRPDAAAQQTREVCRLLATYHAGEAAPLMSRCNYELGWLADERGDATEARAAMQQVHDVRAPIAAAYLAALAGDLAGGQRLAQAAAAGLPGEWWNKFYAGDALLFAASCAERGGQRSAAIAGARAALATYEPLTMIRETPAFQRRLARTKALLAKLLGRTPEGQRLAGEALAWYRRVGGYEAAVAELEKLA